MLESFLANFGINLLQGKDPVTAGRDAGISTASGSLFDKGMNLFDLGGDVAQAGTMAKSGSYNPALQSSFNNNLGNVAPVAKSGAFNPALQSTVTSGGGFDPTRAVTPASVTPSPINSSMTARNQYPFQAKNMGTIPEVPAEADLGDFDMPLNTQYPTYNANVGVQTGTGGGVDPADLTLFGKAKDKVGNFVSGLEAKDIAGGGLLAMNKLDQDRKHKDMLMAQQNAYMKGSIVRNNQQRSPSQILKVKIT